MQRNYDHLYFLTMHYKTCIERVASTGIQSEREKGLFLQELTTLKKYCSFGPYRTLANMLIKEFSGYYDNDRLAWHPRDISHFIFPEKIASALVSADNDLFIAFVLKLGLSADSIFECVLSDATASQTYKLNMMVMVASIILNRFNKAVRSQSTLKVDYANITEPNYIFTQNEIVGLIPILEEFISNVRNHLVNSNHVSFEPRLFDATPNPEYNGTERRVNGINHERNSFERR